MPHRLLRLASSTAAVSITLLLAHCSDDSSKSPDASFDSDAGLTTGDASQPSSDASTTERDAIVAETSTQDAASGDASNGDASNDATSDVDAGPPATIQQANKAATQSDLVSPSDNGTSGDGSADATFEATMVGPIDGLILVTTDSNGTPQGGQQWDTLIGTDAVPSIGTPFTFGSQTWVLGVFEGGVLQNDAQGRIALGAGVHALTLAGSSSGFFNTGQGFRMYAHAPNGNWVAGPVFQW